jgi:thiamine biosynthesis protein ThiI
MSESTATGAREAILVRYGEIALKGGNRGEFEAALVRNLKRACAGIARVRFERERGRVMAYPDERAAEVALRLAGVFGVKSISLARRAPLVPAEIAREARGVLDDALADLPPGRRATFRVQSTRAEKRFPMTSIELDRFVAEQVLRPGDPLDVELSDPELVLGVEVRKGGAWIFARRIPGPGGLPVGTQGKALCLISGGIDSPVAAWMAMKRGCAVEYVTFHSRPFIGEAALKKVRDLVRVLARWQGRSALHVAPFADVQLAIRALGHEGYRTVLYRRMMQRIASRIASLRGARCLVTGESLGQVASQTIENLTCIGAAADLPVLRPLIAFDKEETIAIARRIGTFELSRVQEPDCCTLFLPKHPIIHGSVAECEELERGLDCEALAAQAVAGVERIDVEPEP